jgi:hypothetical protein
MGELLSAVHWFCRCARPSMLFIALFALRKALHALLSGPLDSIFPSGNPAIHLRWIRWLSVIRSPGFWLYTEVRMRACAGIPPDFFYVNAYRVLVPPFPPGLLTPPVHIGTTLAGAAGSRSGLPVPFTPLEKAAYSSRLLITCITDCGIKPQSVTVRTRSLTGFTRSAKYPESKKKARNEIEASSRFGLSGARQKFCRSAKDPDGRLFSELSNFRGNGYRLTHPS